jgi:hypothetical protein
MISMTQISTIGLLLCLAPALVHAVEVVRPLWSRWVVNWVLPLFAPGLPRPSKALTRADQVIMLDAALRAAPAQKAPAGADYIFLMLFEQRQGALAFIAVAAGSIYGLTLPLPDRHALHLVFGIMAALFALVNANHAGLPGLGQHPKVTTNGRNVGFVFAPFWAVAAGLNGVALVASNP